MNEQILSDINGVKHLGAYKLANKYYSFLKWFLIVSFILMCIYAIAGANETDTVRQHEAYSAATSFAAQFMIPILLISIDRAAQLTQLNRIKKRYDIKSKSDLNYYIFWSEKPWLKV